MDIEELSKTEDEQTPTMRTIKGATTGLVAGAIWGTIVATWHDVPRVERRVALPGLIRTLKMMGNYGATFAAIEGVYIGAEQVAQKYRTKRDFLNGGVGGFVAGASVLGYKGKSVSKAISAGAVLALSSTCIELLIQPCRDTGKEYTPFKKDVGKEYYAYTMRKRPNVN